MLLKKALLSQQNLNAAFISKTDTNAQSIASPVLTMGGKIVLKLGGSFISDNENASYLRIDPQGNELIIYDGVNNQKFSVYSSSGTESVYLTTINGTPSKGLIDVSNSIDHLEIATNSGKYVLFGGGGIRISGTTISSGDITSSGNIYAVGEMYAQNNKIVWHSGNATSPSDTELLYWMGV